MNISMVNRIADEPDPHARVRMLIKLLRTVMPDVTFDQDAFLTEMDGKSAFITAAIVSGGHVHDMAMVFHGSAASG
jgi:hypothetical protein